MNKQILKVTVLACLFAVPFIPFLVSSSLFFPFITTKAFAWRIIIEIAFAAWILLALGSPEYRPKRSYLLYALFVFIAVIGVADIFGVAPIKSFWSNAERMEGFISLLHLGMFYVVISSVFDIERWRTWWNTSLAASLLMVVYSVFQLLGALEIHQGGVRVDGTLGNATYLAVYLLFHIFLAVFFLAEGKMRKWKWLYIAVIVADSMILYFTASRGAILGIVGGFLVTALLSLRDREHPALKKFGRIYLAVFVLLVIGFFALRDTSVVKGSPVLSRLASISAAEWKQEGRASVWPMAVEGIKERPILGWGQENFNYVFNTHYKADLYRIEPWFDRAHNIFLDWAIAGGLLGLLSYLSLYGLLLYSIWSRASSLDHSGRAVLTGLLSAYFFHNLFVFDHLVSYILFASLLAFVDAYSPRERFGGRVFDEDDVVSIGTPVMAILLLAAIYTVNIRPIAANAHLISALQQGQTAEAIEEFKKAYAGPRLGKPEIVEQIAANATTILTSSLPIEQRNDFYAFAQDAVARQAAELPDDARYQMLAGDFFVRTGQIERGMEYLNAALTLVPNKQVIYFGIASGQIAKGDYAGAFKTLKEAYDLAPESTDARVAYLVGAIYANDARVEAEMLSILSSAEIMENGSILAAYYQTKQYDKLIALLRSIGSKDPRYTTQANDLVKQIESSIR